MKIADVRKEILVHARSRMTNLIVDSKVLNPRAFEVPLNSIQARASEKHCWDHSTASHQDLLPFDQCVYPHSQM